LNEPEEINNSLSQCPLTTKTDMEVCLIKGIRRIRAAIPVAALDVAPLAGNVAQINDHMKRKRMSA
jgi:hypothetical protein